MRTCPKCKTSDYNNKYFQLMINECGHSLCKNCVDTLFVRQIGPCPVCGTSLKKSQFWEQIFDDPLIEKQTFYRKKLQKIFNLKQDDFPTLRQYNDYLERVETYVQNLTFDLDLEMTKQRIEQFQRQHEDTIVRNKNRLSKDEEWIQKLLDEERKEKEKSGQHYYHHNNGHDNTPLDDTQAKANKKANEAKAVIAELMTSNVDATQIIGRKRYEMLKIKQEAELKRASIHTKRAADDFADNQRFRRLKATNQEELVPMTSSAAVNVDRPYVYRPIAFEPTFFNGPETPPLHQLAELGYLQHIKCAPLWQLAGGYYEALGCCRALQEAHCDLFY